MRIYTGLPILRIRMAKRSARLDVEGVKSENLCLKAMLPSFVRAVGAGLENLRVQELTSAFSNV